MHCAYIPASLYHCTEPCTVGQCLIFQYLITVILRRSPVLLCTDQWPVGNILTCLHNFSLYDLDQDLTDSPEPRLTNGCLVLADNLTATYIWVSGSGYLKQLVSVQAWLDLKVLHSCGQLKTLQYTSLKIWPFCFMELTFVNWLCTCKQRNNFGIKLFPNHFHICNYSERKQKIQPLIVLFHKQFGYRSSLDIEGQVDVLVTLTGWLLGYYYTSTNKVNRFSLDVLFCVKGLKGPSVLALRRP